MKLRLIEPGKPNQNAYIESFNGRFRDECLNEHGFLNLRHARILINGWRREYNEERPKQGLGGQDAIPIRGETGNEVGYIDRRTLGPSATEDGGTSVEHLAPLMWPHGDAIRDQVTQELVQRPRFQHIPRQIAVLGVAFQQPLVFQEAPDAVSDGVGQLRDFSTRRRLGSLEPSAQSIGDVDVDPIQKEHGVLFWNSVDLTRKLLAYRDYYNALRVHRSLCGTVPDHCAGLSSRTPGTLEHCTRQHHCRGLFQTLTAA